MTSEFDCRKTPHKTKADAHTQIRHMSKQSGGAYKCKDCGFYHISRSKPR